MSWYAKQLSSGQGLVIDESDARTVALTYDGEDTPLIAAAPDLLAAAHGVLEAWESGDLAGAVRDLNYAVRLAEGGA